MATRDLHQVAIVGAYNTVQARHLPDETSFSITLDAVRGALADAGIAAADVDGLNITTGTGGGSQNQRDWVHQFGGRPMWMGAQSTGIPAVLEAASAIAAGYCHTVVLANGQAGAYTERASTAPWTRPSNEFVECWGLYTAAEFALIAQRHMHLYGTKPEHLAEVASAVRTHGGMNPDAVYSNRVITPEDVLNSPMIADPFRLLDCAMTGEGGAGLVLTTVERARDLDAEPVYVLGGGLDHRGPSYVMAPLWDVAGDVGRFAAEQAFAACGLGPSDVDVCEFYDPFSFEIIRQFEAYGFCGPGEGGPFVMDGRVRVGGEYPICTDGGTMSFSHPGTAQLLQKVIAGTKQLRGTEGPRQVEDARVAMVSNGGAGALFTDVVLLGNEQP
ncbi:MAG: thiolase family protein [Chloroflexi bacterium]|nr:thiolase family protein [Chloroflexota bacterium]